MNEDSSQKIPIYVLHYKRLTMRILGKPLMAHK